MHTFSNRRLFQLLALLPLLVAIGCATGAGSRQASLHRQTALRGVFGSYDAEPRKPDGRVDVDRLVQELVTIKANTYNFLIWRGPHDWEDFQLFLPRAREHHIKVWVTIVPPSESPPHARQFSEPFRLDYHRWAVEFAKLSLVETNFVAWSLDDFTYNTKDLFTPEYVHQMIAATRAINPKLAFVPCLYYGHIKSGKADACADVFDGILFPYRHEMGKRNLSEWDTLEAEVAFVKKRFKLPVFVDVYATKHSQLNDSNADYVEQVMMISRRCADGVLIYCHQYEDKSPEKYRVIKKLFEQWSAPLHVP